VDIANRNKMLLKAEKTSTGIEETSGVRQSFDQ